MKDRYINALRVVDNFIEGEKCSFQPKINKNYKDNYFFNVDNNENYYYKDDESIVYMSPIPEECYCDLAVSSI